ncbi:hypothetical protein SCUCBS95973_004090 [Sporothrix curviconia]|uniref:Ankyrin repeat protein n=1 Tax=Sporothrix curviconia TaxID=1260050 RepID=A0ABP0BKU4_9PEZI
MDPLSVIASTIALVQAISSAYNIIREIKGLPRAFDRVHESLPLLQKTLQEAEALFLGNEVDPSLKMAVMPIISRCRDHAQALSNVFDEAVRVKKRSEEGSSRTNVFNGSHTLLLKLRKGTKIEALMNDIMSDINELSSHRLFQTATRDQVARLQETIERLSTAEPSVDEWRDSTTSSILWVSADPGCGKSVLAKHLVDHQLPQNEDVDVVCYFFFKDDFEDQKLATNALSCVLHQLFTARHDLLSDSILDRLDNGSGYGQGSMWQLWDILMRALERRSEGEDGKNAAPAPAPAPTPAPVRVVCVFDALDECSAADRRQLSNLLCDFYRHTSVHQAASSFSLKCLVTSRPYSSIRRGFAPLSLPGLPLIHLGGENQEEGDKIEKEIGIFVRAKVGQVANVHLLEPDEENTLLNGLLSVPHRTYLWVYLTLDLVWREFDDDMALDDIVRHLPKSVDSAYDKILARSYDADKARKLLHIVVAAARPLTLQEMNLALALQDHHESYPDVPLTPQRRFREHIRDICGLFVTIIDDYVQDVDPSIVFLLQPDNMPSGRSPTWFEMQMFNADNTIPKDFTNVMIAAYLGLALPVQHFLQHGGVDVDARCMRGRSALHWACCQKRRPIVSDIHSPYGIEEDQEREAVVRLLIDAGANVNTVDNGRMFPLRHAMKCSRWGIARLLLEAGAANITEADLRRGMKCMDDDIFEKLLNATTDATLLAGGTNNDYGSDDEAPMEAGDVQESPNINDNNFTRNTSIFTWENLTYTVNTPTGECVMLDNVHGWANPGMLGACETTLLNVLALHNLGTRRPVQKEAE